MNVNFASCSVIRAAQQLGHTRKTTQRSTILATFPKNQGWKKDEGTLPKLAAIVVDHARTKGRVGLEHIVSHQLTCSWFVMVRWCPFMRCLKKLAIAISGLSPFLHQVKTGGATMKKTNLQTYFLSVSIPHGVGWAYVWVSNHLTWICLDIQIVSAPNAYTMSMECHGDSKVVKCILAINSELHL